MRLSQLVVITPLALAAAFTVTSARADGAFVTLRNASGAVIGTRAPVAAFTDGAATNPNPGAQNHVVYSPATFELDGSLDAAPFMDAFLQNAELTMTVEFTQPDPQGHEEVTTVATMKAASFQTWNLSFDGNGLKGTYSIRYGFESYGTGGPQASNGPVVIRKLTTPLPGIRRAAPPRMAPPTMIGQVPVPSIDGAYMVLAAKPGSPAIAPPPLKASTFSITANHANDLATGAGAGTIRWAPMTLTQAGGPTPQLAQTQKANAFYDSAKISFVHLNGGGAATPVLFLVARLVVVKSDAVALSGGATTETTTFDYGPVQIVDPPISHGTAQ